MSTRLFAVTLLLLLCISTLRAQEPSEADVYLYECIKAIDAGEYEKAWEMLEVGAKRYPDDSSFPYEQAYIRYAQERYDDVQDILEDLIKKPDADGGYYQLLGNAYDMDGDAKKAIRTYEKGLERFPESGQLYLELGVMAAKAEEYEKALGYWERGLTVEPDHSSNFYHAGRLYLMTSERGWGLLYGETFLAMEPGTQRASSMREMLWHGYNDVFEFAGEAEPSEEDEKLEPGQLSLGTVRMFGQNLMLVDEEGTARMPLTMVLEMSSMMGSLPILMGGPPLTVAKLHAFRAALLDNWYQNEEAADHFDLTLFDYQRRLRDAGHLEAYDHLLFLCEETGVEVKAWAEAHPGAFEEMTQWLHENPYPADVNPFSRLTIKGMPMGDDDVESVDE